MAWNLCTVGWKKYVEVSAEPVVIEKDPYEDAPLPYERIQACTAAVERQYGGYVLSPDVLPNQMIMNMMDRNWRNNSP